MPLARTLIGFYSGIFKFLIPSGKKQDGTYSAQTEIINKESSASVTCPAVPNFPKVVFGSAGTLIQKKIPLVCSGYPDLITCYLLKNNAWVQTGSLNQGRYHAVMLPNSPFQNPAHQATIIGGLDANNIEVFNGTSWSVMGPAFNFFKLGASCGVYTNPSTVFIISGIHGSAQYSQDTYYLDSLGQKWVLGPQVTYGRFGHACGRILRSQNGGKLSTLIAGGLGAAGQLDSVEILDDDSSTWRSGPKLPVRADGISIFEDPRGGLIVVGGFSGNMYRLRHAGLDAQWETLAQQPQLKLTYTVAVPIPDEIAIC